VRMAANAALDAARRSVAIVTPWRRPEPPQTMPEHRPTFYLPPPTIPPIPSPSIPTTPRYWTPPSVPRDVPDRLERDPQNGLPPPPVRVDGEGFYVIPPPPIKSLIADTSTQGELLPGGPGRERETPPLSDAERARLREEGIRIQARQDGELTGYAMAHADWLNYWHWDDHSSDAEFADGEWQPNVVLNGELMDDPAYQEEYLRGLDDAAAKEYFDYDSDPERVEAGIPSPRNAVGAAAAATARVLVKLPRVMRYGDRERLPGRGQAHHILQNAAAKGLLSRSAGATVRLAGNVFKKQASAHRAFHQAMETWWDTYRAGGRLAGTAPTIAQYSDAARNAFLRAGAKPDVARFLADVGRRQLTVLRGVDATQVVRVPGRMHL
jgi:hypothetical protein